MIGNEDPGTIAGVRCSSAATISVNSASSHNGEEHVFQKRQPTTAYRQHQNCHCNAPEPNALTFFSSFAACHSVLPNSDLTSDNQRSTCPGINKKCCLRC